MSLTLQTSHSVNCVNINMLLIVVRNQSVVLAPPPDGSALTAALHGARADSSDGNRRSTARVRVETMMQCAWSISCSARARSDLLGDRDGLDRRALREARLGNGGDRRCGALLLVLHLTVLLRKAAARAPQHCAHVAEAAAADAELGAHLHATVREDANECEGGVEGDAGTDDVEDHRVFALVVGLHRLWVREEWRKNSKLDQHKDAKPAEAAQASLGEGTRLRHRELDGRATERKQARVHVRVAVEET
mmetsp:Transcript_4361/g.11306  ORF Transcript_4361/g.11306 Transcript_4361/m.11306 type:complete len:249 (+) Transcript_4361:153-899(+)